MNKYILWSILITSTVVAGQISWGLFGKNLSTPVNTSSESNLEEDSDFILETSGAEKANENIEVPKEEFDAKIVLNNSTNTKTPQEVPVAAPSAPVAAPSTSVSKQVSNPVSNIVLPPKPDSSLVDATLKGVDANNNSIRDEVEYYIAENITGVEAQTLALQYAKTLSQLSSFPLTGTKADVEGASLLFQEIDITILRDKLGQVSIKGIQNIVLNTTERDNRYNTLLSFMFNPDSAIQAKECSTPTTVFGAKMPPEPNKIENDSTLLGIDTNNNHVRDDVERLIACNVKSTNDFVASMDGARQYQKMLELEETPLPRDILLDIYSELSCAESRIKDSDIDGAWSLERDLGRATFNTEMRQIEWAQKTSDFGGYFGSELKECSDS